MLALYGESEPIDVLTVTEHLRSKGLLEQAGGQSAIDSLAGVGPRRRQRPPLRAHRPRARARPPPAHDDLRDPGARPAAVRRAARARRAGRARDARGRPRRPPEGLPLDRGGPRRRARQAPPPLPRGHRPHRHPVGLQGPRRDHRRLPARQPHHHRRKAVDGKMPRRVDTCLRRDDRRAVDDSRRSSRRTSGARRSGSPRSDADLRLRASTSDRRRSQRGAAALPRHDAARPAHRRDGEPPAPDARRLEARSTSSRRARASPFRGACRAAIAPHVMPDHEIVLLAALIADGCLVERHARVHRCDGDSPVLAGGRGRDAACRARVYTR